MISHHWYKFCYHLLLKLMINQWWLSSMKHNSAEVMIIKVIMINKTVLQYHQLGFSIYVYIFNNLWIQLFRCPLYSEIHIHTANIMRADSQKNDPAYHYCVTLLLLWLLKIIQHVISSSNYFIRPPGSRFIIKMPSYQYRIPIIKIRRSHDRLMFITEILYLERPSLYWDSALAISPEKGVALLILICNNIIRHLSFILEDIFVDHSYNVLPNHHA